MAGLLRNMPEFIVYGEVWFALKVEAEEEDDARNEAIAMLVRDDGVRLNVRSLVVEPEEDDDE